MIDSVLWNKGTSGAKFAINPLIGSSRAVAVILSVNVSDRTLPVFGRVK